MSDNTFQHAIDETVRLSVENDKLRAALRGLVNIMLDGSHYETRNPYTRPEVKAALAALAGREEGKHGL